MSKYLFALILLTIISNTYCEVEYTPQYTPEGDLVVIEDSFEKFEEPIEKIEQSKPIIKNNKKNRKMLYI